MSARGADAPAGPTGPLAGRSLCLLSPMHPSANPRLVKEADALCEAGARVRVVTIVHEDALLELDRRIVARVRWRHDPVDARRRLGRSGLRWAMRGVAARRAGEAGGALAAVRRQARFTPDLLRRAVREHADMVIAHTLGALPAGHAAMRINGCRLGYDAEDLESGIGEAGERTRADLEALEATFLPECDQITAASPGIGAAYAERLPIVEPVVIRNVSPASGFEVGSQARFAADRFACALSLYWYSQTIGAGRGLEDALAALARLPDAVHLHLRGRWSGGYESVLDGHARSLGVRARVHHLAHAPPDELVERASVHDVGLALEPGETQNHRLCQSNKLYLYPLAGLAVAASDVPGQRAALAESPEVGVLYPPGDPGALAEHLRRWHRDPGALSAARTAARATALGRWCWERESRALVALVARTLETG